MPSQNNGCQNNKAKRNWRLDRSIPAFGGLAKHMRTANRQVQQSRWRGRARTGTAAHVTGGEHEGLRPHRSPILSSVVLFCKKTRGPTRKCLLSSVCNTHTRGVEASCVCSKVPCEEENVCTRLANLVNKKESCTKIIRGITRLQDSNHGICSAHAVFVVGIAVAYTGK